MNKLFLQTINHNLQPLELWEEGVIGVYSASIFGPFYRKLVETSMQTLTREPLNILNTLGQPTFRIIERLPFSFWSQIVHALYPCHLSRYHKQTAFGFVTGDVINYESGEQTGSVHFEMNRFYILPGTNTHNFYGPLLFGVGEFANPHLVFGIIPESEQSHLLEVSIYGKNTSYLMQVYYKLISKLFTTIAIKSIHEDAALYQRYSNKSTALKFLLNKDRTKEKSPTTCIRSMYSSHFSQILEKIELTAMKVLHNTLHPVDRNL